MEFLNFLQIPVIRAGWQRIDRALPSRPEGERPGSGAVAGDGSSPVRRRAKRA